MTPLERLIVLRDRLLSMDSGSGEAADLTLALAFMDACIAGKRGEQEPDGPSMETLCANAESTFLALTKDTP